MKDKLRFLREEKGLSQIQMGEALGIKPGTYSSYENGTVPKTEVLAQIAKYHNVTMDYLLGLSNERKPAGDALSLAFSRLAQRAGETAPQSSELTSLLEAAAQYYKQGAPAGDAPMEALTGFLASLRAALNAATARDPSMLIINANAAAIAALGVTRMVGEFFQRSDELDVLPMAARANGKHIAKRRTVIQPDEAMEKALLERESDPIG
ncbi:MAG: helix-turn-helix transcriptional regulator [Candidatus Limiplasma sp.]|nr:helix-turn-helix transcriptional regulator [Candidatus Limiplasma sp.]